MKEIINHGMYLNSNATVEEINHLIKENTYLVPIFHDYKNSLFFQKQLILNLYHFLTNEQEQLLFDSDKALDRPLIYLILSFVTVSDELKHFKKYNQENKLFLLLFSIFFTQKITLFLYDILYETDDELVEENILDLIHLSPLNVYDKGYKFIKMIQKIMILELKSEDYASIKFKPFIKEAIMKAKKLDHILLD